jgi:hypothetical protein
MLSLEDLAFHPNFSSPIFHDDDDGERDPVQEIKSQSMCYPRWKGSYLQAVVLEGCGLDGILSSTLCRHMYMRC